MNVRSIPQLARAVPVIGVLSVLLAAVVLVAAAPAPGKLAPGGNISGGFSAPVYEGSELKTQFEGDTVKPAPNGRFIVTKFRLKTFNASRAEELIATADECLFEPSSNTASSPGKLQVLKTDGRFSLEGTGFEWRQKTTQLFISNEVHTVLKLGTNSQTAAPNAAELPLEVTADYFEFDARSNQAVYRGHVRAVQAGRLDLRCDSLVARLPSQGKTFESIVAEKNVKLNLVENGNEYQASGEKAIYTSVDGIERIEITEGARWQTRQYTGSGDFLALASRGKSFEFQVKSNAVVRFPARLIRQTGSNAPGAGDGKNTDDLVEITSMEYEFQGDKVRFRNNVHADSHSGWTLEAGFVEVAMLPNTNRVQNILAADNVRLKINQDGKTGQATGERAVYDTIANDVTLTGNPQWQAQQFSGSGRELKLKLLEKDLDCQATGDAILRLPGTAVSQFRSFLPGASKTNAPPAQTNQVLEIHSHEYQFRNRTATFSGAVRASNPPATLHCDRLVAQLRPREDEMERVEAEGHAELMQEDARLTAGKFVARFSAQTNSVEYLTAENGVDFSRGTGRDLMRGSGGRAEYSAATGVMKLEGAPTIHTGRGIAFKAEQEIIWDLVRQKFNANRYSIKGTGDAIKKSDSKDKKP